MRRSAAVALLVWSASGCQKPRCSESTTTTSNPTFTHAWTDATGRVHALGPSVLSHRLASDTWSDEPLPDAAHFGAGTNDEMWLLTDRGPVYRVSGGPWERAALGDARGLHIGDEVRTVVVPPQSGPPASVRAWNGTRWEQVADMGRSDAYRDATFLPDGRAVVLARDWLIVQEESGSRRVPLEGIYAMRIKAAPDGTLVAFDYDIAVGTIHGMVPIDDQRPAYWFEALPLSATDVWFLGRSQENQQTLVAQWNGSTLDVVHRTADELNALTALPDGSILALGGDRGRLVVRGDRTGFAPELDTLGIARPYTLTIDDTTGEPWAFGPYTAATGRSEFRPVGTPRIPDQYTGFAITAGRTMYRGDGELVVVENGETSTYKTGGRYIDVICGAEGTLYAFSDNRVYRYSGSWETWTLDLPEWTRMTSCWADESDKVFFGYFLDGFGHVAQWNHRGLTVEVSDLRWGPSWMARQNDRFLWIDEGSMGPTRRWGGHDFERVTDLPHATVQTHLRSDGTLFALHGSDAYSTAHRVSARASESDPWELLVQVSERLSMTGWGDDVWAVGRDGRDDIFWSSTCR